MPPEYLCRVYRDSSDTEAMSGCREEARITDDVVVVVVVEDCNELRERGRDGSRADGVGIGRGRGGEGGRNGYGGGGDAGIGRVGVK